jgi:uncharacterized protein (DUF58 family)
LPALLARSRRLAETVLRGAHPRRRVGAGDGFWQYRPYEPGEPAPLIDWRRSARSDELLVRQRERETMQTVRLWLDQSASMDWRSDPKLWRKRDEAAAILLAVGLLLLRGGERVGALGGTALIGLHSFERLARELYDIRAQVPYTSGGPDTLDAPSDQLIGDQPNAALAPPGGVLLVASDFMVDPDGLTGRLNRLRAARLAVRLLHVLDPAEEDLPYAGRVVFADIETGAELAVPNVDALRARYRRVLAGVRGVLADAGARSGWGLHPHRSDRPATHTVLALWRALAQR